MEYLDQFLDFSNKDKDPLEEQRMSEKSENNYIILSFCCLFSTAFLSVFLTWH